MFADRYESFAHHFSKFFICVNTQLLELQLLSVGDNKSLSIVNRCSFTKSSLSVFSTFNKFNVGFGGNGGGLRSGFFGIFGGDFLGRSGGE